MTSNSTSGSAPALIPSAIASAAAAMCTPASSWLIILTVEPWPGAVAQPVEFRRDRVEQRSASLEGRRRTGCHDGELPLRGFLDAARDRCVDVQQSRRFDSPSQVCREGRRDSGTRDDHRARLHLLRQAVGAEDHVFGLRGIHHQDDDGARAAAHFTGRSGRHSAESGQLPLRFRTNIIPAHRQAGT